MTTIAWKDGVLAADTQCVTIYYARSGLSDKIARVGDVLVACCGRAAMLQKLAKFVESGRVGDPPKISDSTGIIIEADGSVTCFEDGIDATLSASEFKAWGSGADFAYGAMAMGASAEEAVRVAIQFDCGSGGDVTVLRL